MNAQDSKFEVSFVMPCLNEAESLESCIKKAQYSIRKYSLKAEIIIADNGSNDGSQQIAENNGAMVVNVEHKGYGAALSGDIVVTQGKFIEAIRLWNKPGQTENTL